MKTRGIINLEEEEKQNSWRVPIEIKILESLFENDEAPV